MWVGVQLEAGAVAISVKLPAGSWVPAVIGVSALTPIPSPASGRGGETGCDVGNSRYVGGLCADTCVLRQAQDEKQVSMVHG